MSTFTTKPTDATSQTGGGMKFGAILGTIVGLVIVGVIGLGLFFVYSTKRAGRTSTVPTTVNPAVATPKASQPRFGVIEINTNDMVVVHVKFGESIVYSPTQKVAYKTYADGKLLQHHQPTATSPAMAPLVQMYTGYDAGFKLDSNQPCGNKVKFAYYICEGPPPEPSVWYKLALEKAGL